MDHEQPLAAEDQRFVNALKLALEADAQAAKTPFDKLQAHEKAFVEASKAFSMIAGAGATALNMFGASIAYTSRRSFNANKDTQSAAASSPCPAAPSPSSSQTVGSGSAQDWMLVATFFCFVYTCLTAAVAHATVHRPKMLKLLAGMISLEMLLLSFVCGLYYYMLTNSTAAVSFIFPAVGCFFMWIVMLMLFIHPAHPGACIGAEDNNNSR